MNAKRLKAAAEDATRALDLGSKSPWARYVRGNARLRAGEPERALKDFEALVKIAPDSPCNYQMRGAAKSLAGRHAEALKDFAKAYSLDEGSHAAALDLSEAMIMGGDAKGAGELAGKLLSQEGVPPSGKAIALYLECCAGMLQGSDVSSGLAAFDEEMKGDFDADWLTEAFEKWLAKADVPQDTKRRISELTARLKAKNKAD